MKLTPPIIITPRLLPGLSIGKAFLSVEADGTYHIDLEGYEYSRQDISCAARALSRQEILATLLTFLSAWVEAMEYQDRTGRPSENADLFPMELAEWAGEEADEISLLGEILASEELISS